MLIFFCAHRLLQVRVLDVPLIVDIPRHLLPVESYPVVEPPHHPSLGRVPGEHVLEPGRVDHAPRGARVLREPHRHETVAQ